MGWLDRGSSTLRQNVDMMNQKRYVCLAFLCLISLNEALRILVSFPLPSPSHNLLGKGVVKHLLAAGHEVVYITTFPQEKTNANLTEISVAALEAKLKEQYGGTRIRLNNLVGKPNWGDSIFFSYFTYMYHKLFLEEDTIKEFLSDKKQSFDAVVLEWFFSDAIAGIAPLFQCPLIWFGSTEAHWQILRLIDEVPNPAFHVDLFSNQKVPLSFWERIMELFTIVKKYLIKDVIFGLLERWYYYNVFSPIAAKRGVAMPSYDEAVYNASFMLINSHPSVGTPFRLPQNVKYIGGYHINEKVQPLPIDLQNIMDKAQHGVIYFSMGSNLKSADMSDDMKGSLLNMFLKLKQDVIWKFEDNLENVPKNVHLVKWAPQQSILAHPNLKMFITHGGQLSTTEAIHFGVPVIGIPVLGDQYVNMKSTVNKGFGIGISLTENIADDLIVAIEYILANTSYSIRAKQISGVYHDRSASPGEELVYWVEHVVRTKGALHLRSPALHVPFYQKCYLDLIAVTLLIIAILIITRPPLPCVVAYPTEERASELTSSSATKEALMKAIKPSDDFQIVGVKKTAKSGVVLRVSNEAQIKKLESVEGIKSAGLRLEKPKGRRPRILIKDVPENMDDKRFLAALYGQNVKGELKINENDFIKNIKIEEHLCSLFWST
ncbi:UDP-glucosyltransferase 2-like [Aphomia sociella]